MVYDEKTRGRALQLINARRARQGLAPMPEPTQLQDENGQD